MMTTLRALPVVLALTSLIPFAAFADHDDDHDRGRDRHGYHGRDDDDDRDDRARPLYQAPSPVVIRPVGPAPRPLGAGQYVLQARQSWVEGSFEQVWVPETCWSRHHGRRTECRGGFYDSQWRPGHYVAVQEWVWVPLSPRFPRATYYPAPVLAPAPYGRIHASASVPFPGVNVQLTGSF